MNYLPGTTVEVNENTNAQGFLESAFATGGLVLSQVVQLTGLEPHTIQNWVKRKFIDAPAQKKYDCNTFCRIAIINMLKDIFHIERIIHMLEYVCRADPAIDNTAIYTAFSDVVATVPPDAITEQTDVDGIIKKTLDAHHIGETAGQRLQTVLKIMILSFISARVRKRAELLLIQTEQD